MAFRSLGHAAAGRIIDDTDLDDTDLAEHLSRYLLTFSRDPGEV